ncbi:Hypothetical protein A7982_13944 [Minicystis rosea]|nr:Hypothetical protein A7982_13944 [Minicystis rosea]
MAILATVATAVGACAVNGDLGARPGEGGTGGTSGVGGFTPGPGVDCVNGPNYTNCPCHAGDTVACYTGPAETRGVGACHDGVQTCQETQELRYAFGPCTGETLPSAVNGACVDTGTGDGGPPGPTRHGMVMFGGTNTQHDLDETWIFDGSTWEQIVTPGPSARTGAMAATLDGKVVLFGGLKGGASLGDTWTFDGATWKELAIPAPPARLWGMLTPLNGKLVLFGGIDGPENKVFGDTWIFDGASWTQVTGAGPAARYASGGGATLGGKLVVHGGTTIGGGVSDEWVFNGTAWTKITASGPAFRFGGVSMSLGGDVLMAGGCKIDGDCNAHYSDAWSFDGTTWTERATSFTAPLWDAMAIQSTANCGAAVSSSTVAIAGHGVSANGDFLDVVVFDGTTWSHPTVPNPPVYRWGCAAASL